MSERVTDRATRRPGRERHPNSPCQERWGGPTALAATLASPTLRRPPSVRGGLPLSRTTAAKLLVVDDEELYRRALERILTRAGHEVLQAGDATEALAIISSTNLDLVLCDLKMPGINGLELIRQTRELEPDLPCILITGHGSPGASVEALDAGAFWYLEKPFEQANLDVIRGLVKQAIAHGRLHAENRALHGQLRAKYKFESIVGKSAALRGVLETVEKVADTDSTVLITGASGTGKELVARALHYNGRRATRALVTVNCGAIPEDLLESELFGHLKGSFTSAVGNREGRFAAAHGGTIFLDEIGDMSPALQVKLLRVLQEREVVRLGSRTGVPIDVRVVAATNVDLQQAVANGQFRGDLFYRLNVVQLAVPTLRERPGDILPLARHFFDDYRSRLGYGPRSIDPRAERRLEAHGWPGNIRELENVIHHALLVSRHDSLQEADLHIASPGVPAAAVRAPEQEPDPAAGAQAALERALRDLFDEDHGNLFERIEDTVMRVAFEFSHRNQIQAARLLGISRNVLRARLIRAKEIAAVK